MDFDFSAEQRQVQQEARRFLTEQCGRRSAREVMESGQTHDAALWQQIAELGWTGISIPEQYGGYGLGYLELCLIAEELGRVVAPLPFSSSLYLAAEALLAFGSEEQKTRWLPSIASGALIATLALSESLGDTLPAKPACHISDARLSGEKGPVADGMVAGLAVVLAEDRGEVSLCVVDLSLDGVRRMPLKTIDPSRGHARIRFDDAVAEPLAAARGWDAVDRVINRAAVLFAFEQIGGADACLDMARDFALDRQVFGRQLGSYQAIKHKLADMYVNNQIARSNSYYGAWALSVDDASLPLAGSLSRVSAIQAYHYAAKENLHTHGGMGFTWEADCHLFYRRAKQLSLALGGERSWKDRMLLLARPH